jgi:predicted Ser/Thr protein kinase
MAASKPCPSCRTANDDDATECFTCGGVLSAVAPVAPIKQGDVIAERYVVQARLGRGGMGTVYKAYDRVLEEDVALKVMRADADLDLESSLARRFRSEIRLARKIAHRNVCRIYEYGEAGGHRFISMELIDGVDLKRLLREHGPFPAGEAYDIALQVAHGLEAIHEAGIVHRDLKTPNAVRDTQGRVKVMDFGIAKRFDRATEASGITGTGNVVGTPEYMSPEQVRAEPLDARSDIYALGVVIFELFTGELPFRADTPMAVLVKHLHEPPPLEGPAAARLPPALRPVLKRALAKPYAERYPSVRELIGDLERARSGGLHPPGGAMARPPVILGAAVPDTDSLEAPSPVTATDALTSPTMPSAMATKDTKRGRRTAGLAVLGAVLLAAAALALRTWRAPAPAAATGTTTLAAPPLPVRINALPWARIRFAAAEGGAAVPALGDDERTTPLLVLLPAGRYDLELENGGITSAHRERIHVGPGQTNSFVFTMPGYDPDAAAEAER